MWRFCSLATKIASVLGGAVIDMENYHDPLPTEDDSNAVDSIDFQLLIQNIQVICCLTPPRKCCELCLSFYVQIFVVTLCLAQDLMKGNSVTIPQFDYQERRRVGFAPLAAPKSGVVRFMTCFLIWVSKEGITS